MARQILQQETLGVRNYSKNCRHFWLNYGIQVAGVEECQNCTSTANDLSREIEGKPRLAVHVGIGCPAATKSADAHGQHE